MSRTALRTCPLCEAMCGLALEIDAHDVVVKVRGDDQDPLSGGYLCPKGARLHDLHADPDRLSGPLVRRDGELVAASWSEAFEAVEAGLRPIWEAHGRRAVALYLGNPNVHNLDGTIWGRPPRPWTRCRGT